MPPDAAAAGGVPDQRRPGGRGICRQLRAAWPKRYGRDAFALDLIVKRLEVLKQINPKMRKVVFLASPEHAGQKLELAASRRPRSSSVSM